MIATRARWRLGIVVPAHNEAHWIGRCIRSLIAAIRHARAERRSWIVVVADACDDDTASLAAAALGPWGEVVTCSLRSVGVARRLGTEALLRDRRPSGLRRLWIMSTDADSRVPPAWIEAQLRFAQRGYAAVAGVVDVDSFAEHPRVVAERFRRAYTIGPNGDHPHVHGANLGVRGDAYLAAGGWRDLQVSEDHCLWRRVRRQGWPMISSASSRVTTSGRAHGRAQGGLASDLRQLGGRA